MDKKLKLTTVAQFEKLVRELENEPSMAQGFVRGSVPANFREKWEAISQNLNAMGPPTRGSDGWQKVWMDLKFKVRKKISFNKAECNATAGGRFKQLPLTALEEAVANLLQFQKNLGPEGSVFGHQEIDPQQNTLEMDEEAMTPEEMWQVIEVPNGSLVYDEISHPEEDAPALARTGGSKKTKANKRRNTEKKERQGLLGEHHKMQKQVFTDKSKTLTSLKYTLKDMKKIEEEKLKLMKRKNERVEEVFKTDMEIKNITLEIKKRELQMFI